MRDKKANKNTKNITVPLEWPEDEKVMEKKVMDIIRTFNYGKYMFMPVGTIDKNFT